MASSMPFDDRRPLHDTTPVAVAITPPAATPTTPASLTGGPAASSPVKRRRTAAATTDCCRTCRLRKVKCTGNPGNGACTNCSRLDLQCSFVNPAASWEGSDKVSRSTPSHSHTEAGTLRKRAQRACKQCHAHKTKCSGDLPRCKRCDASGLACEYLAAKRKFTNAPGQQGASQPQSSQASPLAATTPKSENALIPTSMVMDEGGSSASSTTSSNTVLNSNGYPRHGNDTAVFTAEELLTRKAFILHHVDYYFEHIYWLPSFGFFHPVTTYTDIQNGTMSPPLVAGLCSLASLFINPGNHEFGIKCCDQVENYLFRGMNHFDIDNLILYAITGSYNFFIGAFAKVWQSFGSATRLMMGMQANWDVVSQKSTFAEQEALRRVVWELFNLDRLLAGGFDEYVACREEIMQIRLPCSEAAYKDNRPVIAERLHDKPKKGHAATGLHGHQLRVVDVKHRIQVVTRKLEVALGPNRAPIEPSQVMKDINGLQSELSAIIFALPDELRLNDQNIHNNVASRQRFGYVYLQTHLAASHMDLYRFSLPGIREKSVDISSKLPLEFIRKSQKQAVAHAICLARFCDAVMKQVERLPKRDELNLAGDFTIAHIASQCLRVLLIAWQHELFHDLADHTTVPLWRNEPADEAHVRFLIDCLLKISEPWGDILAIAGSANEKNKKMVREFYKTRTFHDVKGTSGFTGPSDNTKVKLPGPHFILDNAYAGVPVQRPVVPETRRPTKTVESDKWPNEFLEQLANGPFTSPTPQPNTEPDFAPPGVPMFLAHATRPTGGPDDGTLWYDPDDEMIALSTKLWQMSEMNAMLPHPQLLGGDASSLIPMGGTSDEHMYSQQSQSVQNQQHQFMQQQQQQQTPQGMFVNGYPVQYQDNRGSASYMHHQQHGFQ